MSALVLYTPLLSPTIVDGVTNITEGTGVSVSGIVQQQVSLANQPIQSLHFPNVSGHPDVLGTSILAQQTGLFILEYRFGDYRLS